MAWHQRLKVGVQFLSQAVSRLLYVLVRAASAGLMSSVCLFKPARALTRPESARARSQGNDEKNVGDFDVSESREGCK